MEKEKNYTILRWILFLPASLVTYFLVYLIVIPIVQWFLSDNELITFFDDLAFNISRIVSALLVGGIFVLTGYKIAPFYKKRVVFGLFLFLLIKSIVFVYLCLIEGNYFNLLLNLIEPLTAFIVYWGISNELED